MLPFAGASTSLAPLQAARRGPTTFVRYARRSADQGDPKKRIIQRMLYPRNGPRDESPVGTYRPDAKLALRRTVANTEVYETVERAWLLHQRHQRQARTAELQRKWDSMFAAMEELRLWDYDRYLDANTIEDPRQHQADEQALLKTLKGPERQFVEGRIRGLFPREMRIPTSTPARAGWNHDWRSPLVLMEEARVEEARARQEAQAAQAESDAAPAPA